MFVCVCVYERERERERERVKERKHICRVFLSILRISAGPGMCGMKQE